MSSQLLFRGRMRRTLDPKHRLMLPGAFRDVLGARAQGLALPGAAGDRFMLTCYDGCLAGFPMADWQAFEASLAAVQNASRRLRDFRRLVVGSAEELVFDPQGRVRLSDAHLAYAGIEKDVELVGQLEKFEIWSPERLAQTLEQDFSDVAAELADRGVEIPL
ncbi:division/cell wall cluster transcriptional repressor MraZ [Megalodesulfovibrio paquesii]